MKALVAVLFAAMFFFGMQAPAAIAAGDVDVTVTVTSKAGTALPGLEVVAYEVENHHSDFSEYVEGIPVSGLPAGRYQLDGLDTDQDYALYFFVNGNPSAFDQFYGGSTWVEEATLLNWPSVGHHELNATLATNTTITGKVSNTSKKALANVTVTAYRFDGAGWYGLAQATTSSKGTYTLRNLEPGSYRLGFEPNNLTGYAPRYTGGATSLHDASSIYSGLGSTTTSNMTLVAGGRISGTVGLFPFEFNSAGIVPIAYRLYGDAVNGYHGIDKSEFYVGPAVASGCTGSVVHCKWTVPGLPSGGYVVKLYDFSGLLPYYEPMWVDSNDGTDKAADARIFTIAAPASISASPSTVLFTEGDIDLTSLDVTIEDPGGDPVEDADVYLRSDDNNDYAWSSQTDALGIAHFDRIGEGDYIAEITTDLAATTFHPAVETFTLAGTGDHALTFTLAPSTEFAFSDPAVVTWGNTAVGSEFEASVPPTTMDDGAGVDQDVDYDYQWYRGGTAIFGAFDETYVTKSGDVGSEVSVVVTASTFGFEPIRQIAHAGAMTVLGDAALPITEPVITSASAPKPGVVLSASTGIWDLPGLRYSYQWKLDGADIVGATSRTYTVKHADASHLVSVEVTAKKPGVQDSLPSASADVPVAQLSAPVVKKNSVVKATTKGLLAGQVRYSISMGTWSIPGASWHVNWYVDGVQVATDPPVSGANSQNFLYDAADYAGNPATPAIQAVVVADKIGYASGSRTYLVRRGGAPAVDVPGGVRPTWSSTPFSDLDSTGWGELLTATPPQLAYPTMTGNTIGHSYLWQRKIGSKWVSISKATKAVYTTTTADVGKLLRVRVLTTSSLYGTQTSYLSAGTTVAKWDIVGGIQPVISFNGTSDVSATKSALVSGPWAVAGVTQSYQWYTCDPVSAIPDCDTTADHNWTPVPKATAASWTPPASLEGHRMAIAVRASKSGHTSLRLWSDGLTVLTALDEVSHLKDPVIKSGLVAGNAVVGRRLTATPGSVDVAGATRLYTWEFSEDSGATWDPIPDAAHSLAYVPTVAFQVAHPFAMVRFTETASKAGLPGTHSASSAGVTLVPGTSAPTKKPTVSGNATTGYVVNPGTWPAGTSIVVAWREDDGAPTVDSVAPYAFIPSTPGTAVTATVLGTRPGYESDPVRLVARKGTAVFTPSPLDGSSVADTFSAPDPGFAFAMASPGAKYTYRWYSNNVAIKNATKPTFVPSSGYLGRNLSLRITMTSPLYNTKVGTFPATVVTAHPAATGSANLTSSSAARPGVKLTVVRGAYSTSGLAFRYAIQRSTDGGSTWKTLTSKSSYTLTTSDAGTLFRAIVTGKKAGWTTSVEQTGNVAVDWLGPLDTVGPLAISGTGAVGSTLKIAPAWNTSGVTTTYRWQRNGIPIPGVTGTSYTPLAHAFGDEIDVVVTGSKPGHEPVTITSDIVTVGQVLAPAPTSSALKITPSTAHAGVPVSVSSVWNVDGLTLAYEWYLLVEPLNPLSTSATFTPPGADTFVVYVTATRPGYQPATVSRTVVVAP